MRKYQKDREKKLAEIICNCCGRSILISDGILAEDVCRVDKQWGYFSDKDGEDHSFDLCEQCYDKLTKDFMLPPEIKSRTEIL